MSDEVLIYVKLNRKGRVFSKTIFGVTYCEDKNPLRRTWRFVRSYWGFGPVNVQPSFEKAQGDREEE
jgi:hypothetical protein